MKKVIRGSNYYIKKAISLLNQADGSKLPRSQRINLSIELASYLLQAMQKSASYHEKQKGKELARMMEDPSGRAFLTSMTDQCFRSQNPSRTADQLVYLLHLYGIPRFLNAFDRIKLIYFKYLGKFYPKIFVPFVKAKIRQEMDPVLLPEKPKERMRYFDACRREGIRINLNHLGEAILGEEEAEKRLNVYLTDLEKPEIEYISIKISSIFSQINLLGWQDTIDTLASKLRLLFRKSRQFTYQSKEGHHVPKFINLDMEESKDLDLTIAVFQKVLSEEEFENYYAGIVLQSYLPESFSALKQLTDWAMTRQGKIKIRIVKGANLAMEQVESSFKGWPQAPFEHKSETDANFKRMIEFALNPEHAGKVHIGIGSHNLLDIAYALILRAETKTYDYVEFEMLAGMAEPMRRVVQKIAGGMLLYCPETKTSSFQNAVAYLIRRLDENTGQENFLRHLFSLTFEKRYWEDQIQRFRHACEIIDQLPEKKRRSQNRNFPPELQKKDAPFINEPDTDFSLSENREWAEEILNTWKKKSIDAIPLVIEGKKIFEGEENGLDPSSPDQILYRYSAASFERSEQALRSAIKEQDVWGKTTPEERFHLLANVAQSFREKRAILIGAMVADAGKTIYEADVEVSEAIDFIEYYRRNWLKIQGFQDIRWTPRGTIMIAPPWNFPCSIPVGGIAAALMAGNAVLFKPAPETVLVGWEVARSFWDGGIPQTVLQFIPCQDDTVASAIVQSPLLAGVVLTGATQTALKLMKLKPGLPLFAETGGKNAIIVTALADRDLAVRDLVQSAFGHAGQKCSACSLAILEKEVYDDFRFLNQLRDAAASLAVGSAWDAKTKIPPLIRPAQNNLLRGLTQLEPGESWLLEPRQDENNNQLWTPGIKLTQPNSFTHLTELFGPVLAILRADNLQHAIDLANATPYGLTSGLQSLDLREHKVWKEYIYAGNLYINRGITGAVIRRQPFGGCKASSFGPGAKAGGPNYVAQLAIPQQLDLPQEYSSIPASVVSLIAAMRGLPILDEHITIWKKSVESYAYWAKIHKKPIDPSCVLGEYNFFYHVPLKNFVIRFENNDALLDLLRVIAACLICETSFSLSSHEPIPSLNSFCELTVEDETLFLKRIGEQRWPRIRILSHPSTQLLQSCAKVGTTVLATPVLANGRFELLYYLREVSLSFDYHRYGYLGEWQNHGNSGSLKEDSITTSFAKSRTNW